MLADKTSIVTYGFLLALVITFSLWQSLAISESHAANDTLINKMSFEWVVHFDFSPDYQEETKDEPLIRKAQVRVYIAVNRLCNDLSLESWKACVRAKQKLNEVINPFEIPR